MISGKGNVILSNYRQAISNVPAIWRDFSLTFGSNLFVLGLGLFTGALLARLLGPEGRGQLAAIQLWGLYLISLGHLGVPSALVFYTGRQANNAGSFITSAWAIMLPLSLLWIVAGWLILPLLLENKGEEIVAYASLFLLILPIAYVNRASMAFQGLKRFSTWSFFRIHKPILYAGLLVTLGLLGMATPFKITVGFLIISLVGPVLVLILLFKSGVKLARPSLSRSGKLLHYGLRSVAGSAPSELNVRVDQLLMALLLTSAELGIYVVAASWSLILNPFARAISDVVFPHIASVSSYLQQHSLFAASVRLSLLSTTMATIVLLAITPVVVPAIFGDSFQAAVPISMILLVAGVFYVINMVLSNGLRGLGFPEAPAYAEILGLGGTILLLVILLPRFGIIGAAFASLLAYALAFGVLLIFAVYKTPLTLGSLLVPTRGDIQNIRQQLNALSHRNQ
ncbi:MAG: lipopolysaccharide biosynthesis protein [Anaerolineae bacterium]|nr:MAG: lipopolysaccharide biosynthesis protein [Anaerolineae bacterium]